MKNNKNALHWTIVILLVGVGGYIAFSQYFDEPTSNAVSVPSGMLVWSAPTQNVDSTPLNDLVGYRIHCWNGKRQQTRSFVVRDPVETYYELDQLRAGHYQCAVAAISADGKESALSNVVARRVP